MKPSTRLLVNVSLIIFIAAGFSLLFTFSDLRYLADGDRGFRRIEVEEFWNLQVPLAFGLGALTIVVILGLMRSARGKLRDDVVTVVGVGAFAAIFLLSGVTLIDRLGDTDPAKNRPPAPNRPAEVFSRSRWRALGEQTWREERPMGPLLEYGPGLRDFPGYVPFDPCLLERLSFEGMAREQVMRVLGPPIPAVYPERQYLQYKMIESSFRGRIANLVFGFKFTIEQGQIVVEENLYPERIAAACS